MFALLLVVALTVATLALAWWLDRAASSPGLDRAASSPGLDRAASSPGLLTDVCAVIGASVLGGLLFIVAHPAIDLVAEPRDESDGTCSVDELPLLAPVLERISVADARALLSEAQVTFVDARPGHAYTIAHVPGAMNLPAADAEGLLDMQSLPIPPEGQVITYCDGGSCEQSEYLGMILRERDVCQRVLVLDGGWQAWVAAGAPTVAGSNPHGAASVQPTTSEPPSPEEASRP